MVTEAVEVNIVPCSRGRRSTTAWPRGTVFSFCFFSFCNTSITVTREIKREELAELPRQLQTSSSGTAKGLCQLRHMLLLHLPRPTRTAKPRSRGQHERGFFQLAEMGTEVLEIPPPLLLKCYSRTSDSRDRQAEGSS